MTSFKLFAGTNTGLRDNNEDNFTVSRDLTLGEWVVPGNPQETIPLGKWGCLMVVADGMGGQNAGEVASEIAIKTVERMFAPSKFPEKTLEKDIGAEEYLKKVIVEADRAVKQRSKEDSETKGMGSTIVMAWLIKDVVYVGWLGDSRAYSYIPGKGIKRLSKDHSYVQELVDAGILTEKSAMTDMQSNIITRSLGDANQKAKPDVIRHPVVKGEIVMLCSDGLCGVCTDEAIAEIITKEKRNLRECKEALTNAALEAEGSDNITIALLEIEDVPIHETDGDAHLPGRVKPAKPLWLKATLAILSLALVGIFAITGTRGVKSCGHPESPDELREDDPAQADSAPRDPSDTTSIEIEDPTNGVDKEEGEEHQTPNYKVAADAKVPLPDSLRKAEETLLPTQTSDNATITPQK